MAQQHERPWWYYLEKEAEGRRRELAEASLMAWARKQQMPAVTTAQVGKALREGILTEVPPPPDTLGEVLKIQQQRGLR
jgi:hypothetical protein